jgi:hypothetical protein
MTKDAARTKSKEIGTSYSRIREATAWLRGSFKFCPKKALDKTEQLFYI